MRVALVIPGGVDRSGEVRVIPALLALIERLSRLNDVQVFVLRQEPDPGQWQLSGAVIHNIGVRHTRPRAIRAILALHRDRRFDLIHAIWSGNCGLIAVIAAKLLGLPSLIHIAGGEVVALPEVDFGGMCTWRGRLRESWVLRRASAITAASAPVIRRLAELGFSAQRVPLGVDLGRWPPRAPRPRSCERLPRLIHVASLNRVKDQTTLLRALAVLARSGLRFHMDIVGEDILGGRINTLATELELASYVRFHGFLTQRQLRPLIEAADLMIHSSCYETGPLVLLEAAVVGVPTVGTGVGHFTEWAPAAAVAVPVGDYQAIAAAVARLLEDDPLRVRIAEAAALRAVHEDADHTASLVQQLYARLVPA
ncbi:MAG: glycosyltransferase family 4 protein [Steroidobacteraceae bacterium]